MIPQNFKDILSNAEGTGLYQTVALLLFMVFFGGLVYFVMSKPKKYYDDEANAPLDDDHPEDKF